MFKKKKNVANKFYDRVIYSGIGLFYMRGRRREGQQGEEEGQEEGEEEGQRNAINNYLIINHIHKMPADQAQQASIIKC